MKLVLVADTFPPLRTSGAVQLRDLVREFLRQGHELTVLLPDSTLQEAWRLEEFETATILRLKAPKTKDIGYLRRLIGEWLMPYAMLLNLSRSPLRQRQWDGVAWYSPSIFHAPLIRSIKRASRCRSYLILRDIFPEWAADLGLMRKGLAYAIFKAIAWRQYLAADVIGVQSEGNLSYFKKWRRLGKERNLEVLSNWLGAVGVDPCPIRIDRTSLSGRTILVYAGNLGVAQGVDIFFDLAERLRARSDIGFVFVGRGSEVERLNARKSEQELENVLIFDEIDPDEIPDLFNQCHIGLVALDQRHKSHNIPGKFLTYMQNGLPVLASLNPGNDLATLIREEGVGEACETYKVDELVVHCERLLNSIKDNPSLGYRCKNLFLHRFSVDQAAVQISAALANSMIGRLSKVRP